MLQIKAKVIKNIEVTENYYKIALSSSRIAQAAKPGQFLQVRVADNYEPLLRRPFSIHRLGYQPQAAKPGKPNTIEILYEVVGKGTQILSQKKRGEYLDIIGPLGNGFNLEPCALDHVPILVAGGMGVAPLIFLADKLAQGRRHKAQAKRLVLIGAKTKNHILCEKEFQRLGCKVKIATDDGSKGFKGKVSDLLRKILVAGHRAQGTGLKIKRLAPCVLYHEPVLYACGPRPMLKEISRISKEYKIPAQVSLEEHMACGIGACLGCVVKAQGTGFRAQGKVEHKRVCKEGPVFDSQEVIW